MENGDNLGIYLLDVSCSRAGCIVQAVLYCIAPGIDVIDGKLALSVVEGLFDLLGYSFVSDGRYGADVLATLCGALEIALNASKVLLRLLKAGTGCS